MQLQIRQRVFTIGDNYKVYDERGNIRYVVEEQVLSLVHKLNVYEYETNQLAGALEQKPFRLLPAFRIVLKDEEVGEVSRSLHLFRPEYKVDFRNWRVEGNFLGWDYRVVQGDLEIMSISKEPLNWGDTYILRYSNAQYELPGLLIVLAIDAANRSK